MASGPESRRPVRVLKLAGAPAMASSSSEHVAEERPTRQILVRQFLSWGIVPGTCQHPISRPALAGVPETGLVGRGLEFASEDCPQRPPHLGHIPSSPVGGNDRS